MDAAWVRNKVRQQKWHFSGHAEEERLDEQIEIGEIEQALIEGEILEAYPKDPRGPSALLLGYGKSARPIHIVIGEKNLDQLRVITVYIPAPPKWTDPKTRS